MKVKEAILTLNANVVIACERAGFSSATVKMIEDALDTIKDALKEQESLLGIRQTADGITFISTGTAQEGEKRGIILGKELMHEWLYKELLCKDLLTDEIRSVFDQAESI